MGPLDEYLTSWCPVVRRQTYTKVCRPWQLGNLFRIIHSRQLIIDTLSIHIFYGCTQTLMVQRRRAPVSVHQLLGVTLLTRVDFRRTQRLESATCRNSHVFLSRHVWSYTFHNDRHKVTDWVNGKSYVRRSGAIDARISDVACAGPCMRATNWLHVTASLFHDFQ